MAGGQGSQPLSIMTCYDEAGFSLVTIKGLTHTIHYIDA